MRPPVVNKTQFRHRASDVPNLIAIRFDCRTAELSTTITDSDVVPESYQIQDFSKAGNDNKKKLFISTTAPERERE